tara:strand:+ start:143 stop:277 length:135 start_codon:yes stop_codon:yes gene_type:complete
MSKTLAKEIELKKKNRLKESGSISVLGSLNKPSTNGSKLGKNNK